MFEPLITGLPMNGVVDKLAEAMNLAGKDVNAEMMLKDPHGIIMTITSVTVVFLALFILYLSYSLIGKIVNTDCSRICWRLGRKKAGKAAKEEEIAAAISLALKEETSGEVQAAIAMALEQELDEYPHDQESYIITIKR